MLFEFRQQRLENAIEILEHIIVPDTDHPIIERAKCAIAVPVVAAFRVLAAVEFDNQAPLPADKVHVIAIDRLLADKFEAAELSSRMRVHSVNSGGVMERRNDRARSMRI
jgi:hypothetical protein